MFWRISGIRPWKVGTLFLVALFGHLNTLIEPPIRSEFSIQYIPPDCDAGKDSRTLTLGNRLQPMISGLLTGLLLLTAASMTVK